MTEDELRRVTDRGIKAQALLDSDLVKEAFEALDARCWEAFKGTALNASGHEKARAEREYIATLLRIQADFKRYFVTLVTEGRNAQALHDHEQRIRLVRPLTA